MKAILILAAMTLSGCAATSASFNGPGGKPVFFVDGMTADVAFSKAVERCPNGYRLLGPPVNSSFIDFKISFQCEDQK